MSKTGKIALKSLVAAASLSIGLALVPASAEDILVRNSDNAEAEVSALMQSIMPFVNGEAQTTTNIAQIGENNTANSSVKGSSSLSLIQQSGSNNRAVQAIEGANSALLLVQGGTNNNVLQASKGNRNFQMVGVSGNDNNVAYLQAGNDLAGALDVRDSQNSNVLAIQTPQSGRYLMPTGLRGLQNTTVVIVPGRMYVIPK
ncbi:MAG: hypothetical protein INR68_00230 [Methylobacterium mesophilicum]|nr:hypothetical protein [Methylobacterium mesophilicum]